MSPATEDLAAEGVSIWLDDLSRHLVKTGGLAELVATRNVSGVTTNPTIFAGALASDADAYTRQIIGLAERRLSSAEAIFEVTTEDVRDAADVLREVYISTDGYDGRVSIEVSPLLAHDSERTIAQAKALWAKVDRPNALIKIPATEAGLPAITEVVSCGISVNVTLIFSLERYSEVISAYLAGLELAERAGHDLSRIHSVASFFISRVDIEVDRRLEEIGTKDALALKNLAGLSNARLAYELFKREFDTSHARALRSAGANVQRPLWASTGVKDPSLPDTLYVTQLVAAETVNTMPARTLEATFDHGLITGDTVTGGYAAAREFFDSLRRAGVDFADVARVLEEEGVDKFVTSWRELQETMTAALAAVGPTRAGSTPALAQVSREARGV